MDSSISCILPADMMMHIPNLDSFSYSLFSLLTTNTATNNGLASSAPSSSNVLISPFSIASALALVLAGATIDSLCQTQIQSALNIQSHTDLPLLSNRLLSSKSSGVEIQTANGIWTNKDIKSEFIQIVKDVHNGVANKIPTSLSYDAMNEFVEQNTNGMITDLFQGSIDPLTVAILVNAVYFKGSWKEQFDKRRSIKGVFNALKNDNTLQEREAMFMRTIRKIHAGRDIGILGGGHAALLEYGSNSTEKGKEDDEEEQEAEFGALLLLPAENSNESMESMITNLVTFMKTSSTTTTSKTGKPPPPAMHHLLDELYHQKVNLALPRFKLSYGVTSIKSSLQALGMKEPFDPLSKNKFDEMTLDPLVYIDDVYHKAVMEVNEEGTVAAAATGVIMATRAMPKPPLSLKFDRPFVMIVFHMESGLPLFMGKIDDPEF